MRRHTEPMNWKGGSMSRCILKEDLGCLACYVLKPSLLQYCGEAPNISDIEAYILEKGRANSERRKG